MSVSRRSFLQVGLGSAVVAGLGGSLWRRLARGDEAVRAGAATSCILLYMQGGPSQIDTFDPKPGRDTGGEFKAIGTAVKGLTVSEHLPGIGKRAGQLAVVRSLTAKEGNHVRARHLMHTGYPPQGGVDHPALGSLVLDERGQGALPGYVSIAGPGEDAGFLGAGLSPFTIQDPTKPVRHLAPFKTVDDARFARRMDLWRKLEDEFAAGHPSAVTTGQREIGERAVATMSAKDVAAFELDGDAGAAAYGDGKFGKGCLMARRLVEVGVPFVEVTLDGWDTHQDNFATVKRLSGELDQAMSALLDDLDARGLLKKTLVVWLGDFGRTPTINGRGGRDHYPKCSSVVLAGGGVKGGQVIGATDKDGVEIAERPVSVPDLFRTMATALGLDVDRVRHAPSGRPIKTVDGGAVIDGVLA
jgi:uncharacterized protein (DUF1501 family)